VLPVVPPLWQEQGVIAAEQLRTMWSEMAEIPRAAPAWMQNESIELAELGKYDEWRHPVLAQEIPRSC